MARNNNTQCKLLPCVVHISSGQAMFHMKQFQVLNYNVSCETISPAPHIITTPYDNIVIMVEINDRALLVFFAVLVYNRKSSLIFVPKQGTERLVK